MDELFSLLVVVVTYCMYDNHVLYLWDYTMLVCTSDLKWLTAVMSSFLEIRKWSSWVKRKNALGNYFNILKTILVNQDSSNSPSNL